MDWSYAGIGAIGTIVGVIITAAGNFVINLRKQNNSDDIAVNLQAMQIYSEALKEIKKDRDAQEKDLVQLSKERLECRERCASLVMENKYIVQENLSLKAEISNLNSQIMSLRQQGGKTTF